MRESGAAVSTDDGGKAGFEVDEAVSVPLAAGSRHALFDDVSMSSPAGDSLLRFFVAVDMSTLPRLLV